MSKRFIDTGLFDDYWFMELSKDAKLLWLYMITKCDHAGIISLNKKLIQFQTGIKDLDNTIKELGNRLVTVKELLFFIPKYIEFQYPNFPNSNVKQQQGAITILEKYDLFKDNKITVTKELSNTYDNDNVIGNEKESPKKFIFNSFYDNEISKTDNEKYKQFVEFLFKDNELLKPLDIVLSMKDQITPKYLETLLSKYTRDIIKSKVIAMENTVGLKKKYVSFYATLDGWCRRELK